MFSANTAEPAQLVPIVTEAVGPGFETVFREKFDDVTDEEWARADPVVGGCPPQYIDKLKNWMSPEVDPEQTCLCEHGRNEPCSPLRQFAKREPEPTIPDANDAVTSDDASPLRLSYQ